MAKTASSRVSLDEPRPSRRVSETDLLQEYRDESQKASSSNGGVISNIIGWFAGPLIAATSFLIMSDEIAPPQQRRQVCLKPRTKVARDAIDGKLLRVPATHHPIQAQKPYDWEKQFEERFTPSNTDDLNDSQAAIAAIHPKYHEKARLSQTVHNAWMPGGEFYKEVNPKRSVAPSSIKSSSQWSVGGSIAGQTYQTIHQGNAEGSRINGPQPGDPEWETIESQWEARLCRDGPIEVMVTYQSEEPRRYKALTAKPLSPVIQPRFGEGQDTQKLNEILKTSVPTVAFKLTQLHFGREVSPLKGNEPLVRGRDPLNWDNASREIDNTVWEPRIQEQLSEMNLLDASTRKYRGDIRFKRRQGSLFQRGIHRSALKGRKGKDGAQASLLRDSNDEYDFESVPQPPTPYDFADMNNRVRYKTHQNSTDIKILLHGKLGGLYLPQDSYDAFIKIAKRLLYNPDLPSVQKATPEFIVDVTDSDLKMEPRAYKIDGEIGRSVYKSNIRENFAVPGVDIRIRPDQSSASAPPSGEKKPTLGIKLSNKDIGYFNFSWPESRIQDLERYSEAFVNRAVRFLFPKSSRITQFTLQIPRHVSFDIDISSPSWTLPAEIADAIANLNSTIVQKTIEVVIYETSKSPIQSPQPEPPIPTSDDRSEQTMSRLRDLTDYTLQGVTSLSKGTIQVKPQNDAITVTIVRPARYMPRLFHGPFTLASLIDFMSKKHDMIKVGCGEPLYLKIWPSQNDYNQDHFVLIDAKQSDAEIQFQAHVTHCLKPQEVIYITKYLPKIRIIDGTNESNSGFIEWDEPRNRSSLSKILSKMSEIIVVDRPGGFHLKVAKYGEEWLFFDSKMSEKLFVKDVLNKIDDSDVNVYPEHWKRSEEFEDSGIDRQNSLKAAAKAKAEQRASTHGYNREPEEISAASQSDFRQSFDIEEEEGEEAAAAAAAQNQNDLEESLNRIIVEPSTQQDQRVFDEIPGIPKYSPSSGRGIDGGPDFPATWARVLTASQIQDLKLALSQAENELMKKEEYCRVCRETFAYGSSEITEHYSEHRAERMQLCPFCGRSWAEWPTAQRQEHMTIDHPQGPPQPIREDCPYQPCPANMADGLRFPGIHDIMVHFQEHDRQPLPMEQPTKPKTFCQAHELCRADISNMTDLEKEDHFKSHEPMVQKQLDKDKEICTQNRHCGADISNMSPELEHYGSHDPISPPVVEIDDEEADADEYFPVDKTVIIPPRAGVAPQKSLPAQDPVYIPEQPSTQGSKAVKAMKVSTAFVTRKFRHCPVCWKNVNHLSKDKKVIHAKGCKISTDDFQSITVEEGKNRKNTPKVAKASGVKSSGSALKKLNESTVGATPKKRGNPHVKFATKGGLDPAAKTITAQTASKKRKTTDSTYTEPASWKAPKKTRTRKS
ncbi:MAG: hypothetical protein M1827_001944 [Pycnora praestabilis]|nr:MAG: hypothetical protein M1827_001944 [Pycnora praestabilis]